MLPASNPPGPSPYAFGSMARNWAQPSLARNVALNWMATGTTILSALVVTPVIVKALQKELYGIWSFLNGLITYSDLLYLGLGAALVKYAAEHIARRDTTRLNRLCSVVVTIYVVAGLMSLGLCALVAHFVSSLFANGLEPSAAAAARYTCVLLGFRVLSLFVCSAYGGVLVAADRTDLARLVTVAFTLIRLALIPLVVTARSPLVALALLIAVSAACETAVTAQLAVRMIRGLRIRLLLPDLAELRFLYGFGLQSFLVIMAVKLVSYTDQTVIGLTLGAAAVALYSLPLQLIEYGRVGINGIVAVLLPRLTILQINGDRDGLADAYINVSRITCGVAAFVNASFICLGPAFLRRWVGPDFAEPASVILLCLGVASVLQALSTQAPLPFLQATRRLKVPAVVLLAEGVVNVALSLALIPSFGLKGVALGTLIPSLCVSFLVIPPYVSRELHVSFGRLARQAMLPAAGVATLTITVISGLNTFYRGESYAAIAAKAAVAAVVLFAAVIAIGRNDRRALLGLLGAGREAVPASALGIRE